MLDLLLLLLLGLGLLGLLLLLLNLLHLYLLHLYLLLVRLLLLHLLLVVLLGWTLRLNGLLNHLTGGGDYLYLIDCGEQMSGDGSGQGAQVRHQALVASVQTQMEGESLAAVEGTATLAARVLWSR